MPSYVTNVNVQTVAPGSVLIPLGVTQLTFNYSSIDTAAVTSIATSVATSIANAIVNDKQTADGSYVLPPPTGTSADDAVLTTALASGRKVVARVGTYGMTSHHVLPDGVDLIGQGGGSTSRAGRTVFKCLNAAAQLEIQGGGGLTGGFEIDGNLTATTPFFRSGGTGANARSIHNLTVHDNAVSGTNSNDLCQFWGAQNDYYYNCGFADADRDLAWFDQGFGGVTFERCEWRTAGRYWHRYDNQVAGGVSAFPFNIVFTGTNNMEGNGGVSHVKMFAGADITYDKTWFYSANALTGPSLDIGSGCIINLVNPSFQSKPSGTPTAGTKAISVAGTGRVTVIGRAQYLNFDKPINIDGFAAHIFDSTPPEFYNCNTPRFTGTSGATTFQWEQDVSGLRTTVPYSDTSPASAVQVGYNAARSALLYELLADGTQLWFPGSGFGAFDASWGRIAPGIIGPKPGGGQLFLTATGGGNTASRPTPPGGTIAMYGNTGGTFDWWDGTQWRSLSVGGGGVTATAPRDLPSYVTSASHVFQPDDSSYNANGSTLHGIRAASGKVYHGDADMNGATAGDSILAGYNGTSYVYETCVTRTIGKQLAKAMDVPFCNGIQMAAADTTASPGKVYDNVTRGTFVANTQYLGSTGTGQTCSFVTLDMCTTIDIFYYDGIGSGTLGVTIDGVAQTGITIGATNTVKKQTYTGLTNGIHTVAFTSTAANQLILAWWWRNPNIKQLYMHCLSIGGSCANTSPAGPGAAANWSSNNSASAPFGAAYIMSSILTAAGVTLDFSVISAGGNDLTQGTANATIDTGIANMLGYSWLGATKLFMKVYKPIAGTPPTDPTFDAWSQLMYARMDTANVAMFDTDHYINRRAGAVADGLIGADGTHPLEFFQQMMARCVAKILATGIMHPPLTQVRLETVGASSYPPRYSPAIVPAGKSIAIGADQPPDAVNSDPWFDLP